MEARYSEAVREAGAPAPRLLGVEQVAGRPASVWERIPGPSMWACALLHPDRAAAYGAVLAEVQLSLFELVPPIALPRQRDRLVSKIHRSAALVDAALIAALEALPTADTAAPRVCHGDLHPGNVILADDGPVVVDWFDASRGDPVADIARSSILMALGSGTAAPRHLPGADAATLAVLSAAHLSRMRAGVDGVDAQLERWRAIESVARLAEEVEPEGLLDTWRRFARAAPDGP